MPQVPQMTKTTSMTQVTQAEYSHARTTKDKNFDGVFYFGVKTTGIFCRPSCPSPVAKEENVLYFSSLFEALEQNFRPCKRCRPDIEVDYYTGNPTGIATVRTALHKIYNGYLNFHSVAELAAACSLSERHLRKLFIDNIGIPPNKIARYHRALFAHKMLQYSDQTITDIAFASGFGSTRQFNDVFKSVFAITPTAARKGLPTVNSSPGCTRVLLPYQKSFNYKQILSFMEPRIMQGVETVVDGVYSRSFRINGSQGFFTVCDKPEQGALGLCIHCDDIRCTMPVYNRVKRMFDLDIDATRINEIFNADPLLSKGMTNGHIPHLPVAFDPFEFSVRAILGQQVSVKAATTIAARIAAKNMVKCPSQYREGLLYFFPTPKELAELELDDIGLTRTRANTVKNVTQAVLENAVSLSSAQTFQEFHDAFIQVKGIGEWTVNYVAMRGLGMIDCFPAADLGVIKALAKNGNMPSPKECLAIAEQWRPYRTYATLCLWNTLG